MKTNYETIKSRLDHLAADRDEKAAKWNKEVREAKAKADRIESELKTAEDPTEYKRLLQDKRETEDFLAFLNKSKKTTKAAISEEEHREIQLQLADSIRELQSEYAPKIDKAAEELKVILAEYNEKCMRLEDLRDQASILLNGHPTSTSMLCDINDQFKDPLFYTNHLASAFFVHHGNVLRLAQAIQKGSRNPWHSTEDTLITKELEKRMRQGKR